MSLLENLDFVTITYQIYNFLGGGPLFGSPGCYQNLSPGGGPLFRSLGCYQNLSLGMHIWTIIRNSMEIIIYSNIWDSKAKQGHSNTMPIHSNFMPRPPILSIALECMGMVLECPYLASESQAFQ